MKTLSFRKVWLSIASLLLLALPLSAQAALQLVACFEYYTGGQKLNLADQAVFSPGILKALPTSPSNVLKSMDCLPINSLSYDFVQVLNIGSQSSGAGAGKIAFDPLTLHKNVDALSPFLFMEMAAGSSFSHVHFFFLDGNKATDTYQLRMVVQLALAAIRNMQVTAATDGPLQNNERVDIEYGGIQTTVYMFNPNGTLADAVCHGWNKVQNVNIGCGGNQLNVLPTMITIK